MSAQICYETAFLRERKARIAAEKELDEKSKEVCSGLNTIEYQFNAIERRKMELELLVTVAQVAELQLPIDAAVDIYVSSVAEFLGAMIARTAVGLQHNAGYQPRLALNKVTDKLCQEILFFVDSPDHLRHAQRCIEEGVCCHYYAPISEISREEHLSSELLAMEQSELQIVFLPVRCNGETVAVCEVMVGGGAVTDEVISQLMTVASQISLMLERQDAQKQLEKNYHQLKSAHDNLKSTQSQLVHSEKMACLGQLAAGVAHEINNPVGFVLSNVETLTEYVDVLVNLLGTYESVSGADGEKLAQLKQDQDVEFILEDIDQVMVDSKSGLLRVKDIVNNLKSFARADDGEKKSVDVNECLASTLKVVWNELKYHVEVKFELQEEIPDVCAMEGELSQVFMNLLVNAGHAIEGNGVVNIKTYSKEGQVFIRISDDGCGISPEIQSKIFDPFFTTKPVDRGTGLGLSISYGIIQGYGGSIGVESSSSNGTSFLISLPCVSDSI